MAVTIPTEQELTDFWGSEADTSDTARLDLLLNLSADLFWLATGMEDDPTDARLAQLVQYAICDMAIYLYVSRDNVNESYSPFSSERIGSYSYSKVYRHLSRTVASGEATGAELFDRVVASVIDSVAYDDTNGTIIDGKKVFSEDYVPLGYAVWQSKVYYGPFGTADVDTGTWY